MNTIQIIIWVTALIPTTLILAMILGVYIIKIKLRRMANQMYKMAEKSKFNNDKETHDRLKEVGDSLLELSKEWKL